MSKPKVRMWVNPTFKKMLKRKAVDLDCDLLDLTEKMAKKQMKDIDEGIFQPINKNFKKIL